MLRRAHLHRRKPESVQITWALVISGVILYIPANLYPVFTIVSFGRGNTSTILGGVRQLLTGSDWPLAIIIFVASIVVPLIKLIGLGWLLIAVRWPRPRNLRANTRLHRLIEVDRALVGDRRVRRGAAVGPGDARQSGDCGAGARCAGLRRRRLPDHGRHRDLRPALALGCRR